MKKSGSRIVCGMLSAAVAATLLTGCGKLDGNQTVATVNGEAVPLGLASYMVRDQQAQTQSYYQMFAQSYGITVSQGIWDDEDENGKSYGENAKDQVMDNIRDLYLLRSHAEEYDVTITEEEQAKIDEAVKAFIEANDDVALAELAVTEDNVAEYLELMTYSQKMRDPMVADVDQEVSDEEANQTRITLAKMSLEGTETDEDGNTIDLTDEEKAEKKELMETLLSNLQEEDSVADADVSELASAVDDGITVTTPAFTTAGGEDETVDEAVQKAALELEEGEAAPEVIEAEDAYYVVRLDKMFDEDATANKIKLIISDREDARYDELLQEWRDAAEFSVVDDVWNKITVTDKKIFVYKEVTTGTDTTTEDAASESTPEAETDSDEDAASEGSSEEDAASEDGSEEDAASEDGSDEDTASEDGSGEDASENDTENSGDEEPVEK